LAVFFDFPHENGRRKGFAVKRRKTPKRAKKGPVLVGMLAASRQCPRQHKCDFAMFHVEHAGRSCDEAQTYPPGFRMFHVKHSASFPAIPNRLRKATRRTQTVSGLQFRQLFLAAVRPTWSR
jgi:hypothetical protein